MIRKLLRSVREFKKNSILSPLFVSLEVVLEVIIPLFTARLIDEGIDRGNMAAVLSYGAILIAFCALSLMFGALSGMTRRRRRRDSDAICAPISSTPSSGSRSRT